MFHWLRFISGGSELESISDGLGACHGAQSESCITLNVSKSVAVSLTTLTLEGVMLMLGLLLTHCS